MNDTIITQQQKTAITNVVQSTIAQERENLEGYICDNAGGFGEPTNEDTMTDAELFKYCQESGIKHLWCELYILSDVK